MTRPLPAYSARVLAQYVDERAHQIADPLAQVPGIRGLNSKTTAILNGLALRKKDLRVLRTWRDQDRVSVAVADVFLLRFGIYTFEFEQWAEREGMDPWAPAVQLTLAG